MDSHPTADVILPKYAGMAIPNDNSRLYQAIVEVADVFGKNVGQIRMRTMMMMMMMMMMR